GAVASGALLYGMSLIYGLTGTMDLGDIAARLQAPFSPGVILGLTFIVVAVAFKLGAVPFHMWLPDVYEGAPTSVTLFIGTAPKIARSEEHTSELQSRRDLVCRLLLEKKKIKV